MEPRSQRGFTLTELTLVMALAALVTVGLVTFYLNSQGMWVDASTQAMIQRDATLIIERITHRTHVAYSAEVLPDPDMSGVILFARNGDESSRFWWNDADSLIHYGIGTAGTDRGPVAGSKVERFEVDRNNTHVFVTLKMLTASGEAVEIKSSMAFYNK
jgi:prepilin-type N-terminal cleavage/methylation domain-containing protein